MRMKWKGDTKDCLIQVADASFNYSFEYVGNTGSLVITPLTDRCYITLTQALRLIMGGRPARARRRRPRTWAVPWVRVFKTETPRRIACRSRHGCRCPCTLFPRNCSEQMNVQSLGTIFKGLAQTGAWGCFDEFNRIPIEVLSVVSTQVSCILNGVREKRSRVRLHGGGHLPGAHCGYVHHHEPGLCGPDGAAGEPQGAVPLVRHGGAGHEPHLREHADERGLPAGAAAGQEVHYALLPQSPSCCPSRSTTTGACAPPRPCCASPAA